MKIKNAVYLNADKTKAVPDGDPEASFLLVGRNGTVTEEQAKKYKLTELGAPGQKDAETAPLVPSMVNESCPDGVNTAPGTPAAMPILGRKDIAAQTESDSPNVGKKEVVVSPAPAHAPAPTPAVSTAPKSAKSAPKAKATAKRK